MAKRRKPSIARFQPTRDDIERLRELADNHFPDNWNIRRIYFEGHYDPDTLNARWTLKIYVVSDGGKGRHTWFDGFTPGIAYIRAQDILSRDWQGFDALCG